MKSKYPLFFSIVGARWKKLVGDGVSLGWKGKETRAFFGARERVLPGEGRSAGSLDLIEKIGKCFGLIQGQVGQNFPVESDPQFFESRDKPAIADPLRATG